MFWDDLSKTQKLVETVAIDKLVNELDEAEIIFNERMTMCAVQRCVKPQVGVEKCFYTLPGSVRLEDDGTAYVVLCSFHQPYFPNWKKLTV